MNRMLRFVLGPLAFLYYMLKIYCASKQVYPGALLGQALQVVGGVWLVVSLIFFCILFVNCFGKKASEPIAVVRTLFSLLLVYAATYSTMKFWFWMAARSDGSLYGFLGNIPIFFAAFFLLCAIPALFGLLVKQHASVKEQKNAPKPPEKPRYVREQVVRLSGGKTVKKTISSFKGKTVIDYAFQ